MITLGILLAYIIDLGTKDISNSASYRIPIGLQILWGLILGAGCPFLPKSPREAIQKGNVEDARRTISSMHGVALHHPLVEYTVKEIQEKINVESSSSYLECFNFKSDLRVGQRTLIGMAVQSFQQLSKPDCTTASVSE